MIKYVQLLIELFVLEKLMKFYLMSGKTRKMNFHPINCFIWYSKASFPFEKGRSAVPIIREFHDWLLIKKYPDPPYYTEAFQRDIYTVFEPGPDVAYTADIYHREVSRMGTAVQQIYYCKMFGAFGRHLCNEYYWTKNINNADDAGKGNQQTNQILSQRRIPQSVEDDDNIVRLLRYFRFHYLFRQPITKTRIRIMRFKLRSGGDLKYKSRLDLISERNDAWLNINIPEIIPFWKSNIDTKHVIDIGKHIYSLIVICYL